MEVFPPWPLFLVFLTAAFVLAVTPGPGVLYIVTRSLAQGRRAGLASVAGVALGNLGNALAAALGLGTLLAVSSTAFLIVKYVGALYLIYLGIQVLRRPGAATLQGMMEPLRTWKLFRDGFVVALFNPKTAIFFAAFLPQFMTPSVTPVPQSILLGALFVAIAAITDAIYALAAGGAASFFLRARGVRIMGRYLSGCAFIGLGTYAAFAGARSGK